MFLIFRGSSCFHLQLTVVTWDFIGVQRGRYLHAVDQRAWKSVAGPRRVPGFMPLWVVGIQFVYDLRFYGRIGLSFNYLYLNYYFKCNPIGFIWIGSDLNQIWLDCKFSGQSNLGIRSDLILTLTEYHVQVVTY